MIEDIIIPPAQEIRHTKKERLGKDIVETIYTRNVNAGGSFTEITSAPGAGKTSLMLSLSKRIMQNNKNEMLFWSSTYGSPLQFFRLPYNILLKKDIGITFWNRYEEKNIDLPHQTFTTYEELYQKSRPKVLNCPFFGDRTEWMDFIEWLLSKKGWHTVLIDEISEIAPLHSKGELYSKIDHFANYTLTQARKCFMTVICNTQSSTGTDWKVRQKLNNRIYLPGARVEKKAVRVFQKAVDNLREDHKRGSQAYICAGGRFGVIECKDVFTPVPNWSIDVRTKDWNSENNGRKERTEEITNKADEGRCGSRPNNNDKLYKWKDKRHSISN